MRGWALAGAGRLGLLAACLMVPGGRGAGARPSAAADAEGSGGAAAAATIFDGPGFAASVAPFLERHCLRCHRGADARGEVRLSELPPDFLSPRAQARWRAVADVLELGSMPPKDEPRPPPEEVAAILTWLGGQTARAEARRRPTEVVLRRLNRLEYRNTVRDLTGLEPDLSGFPLDPPAGGLRNNGRALGTSPLQVELYLAAARDVLDRALVSGPRPARVRWRFQLEEGEGDDHRVTLPDGQRPIVHGARCRKQGPFTVLHHDNWDLVPNVRDLRVPGPGEYVLRLRAGGRVPGREEVVKSAEAELRGRREQRDREAPGRAAQHQAEYAHGLAHFERDAIYDYGPARLRLVRAQAGKVEVLGERDLPDLSGLPAPAEGAGVWELRTRLGAEPLDLRLEYAYSIPAVLENFWITTRTGFARPEAWVDWIEIEGPLHDDWPPSSHRRILGPAGAAEDQPGPEGRARARQALERFMTRAYRRAVTPDEVQVKLALFDNARRQGASFIEAVKLPLLAVLTSPHFLFLVEPTAAPPATAAAASPGPTGAIDDFQLASRLSYFLWSTMPDGELFQLAAQGRLHDRAERARQTRRLLADPRSAALAEGFASDWLRLGEVGANPPIPERFPHYDRHLELSMTGEGRAFFDEVLRRPRSVLSFLRADFLVINERLARFYGVPGVRGDHFRVVPRPAGSPRGGLATQAAMLTLTSNGTRTSPVRRGVWLLETLLGVDPGDPVPGAGEIAPRVPGPDQASVRQRLDAHRKNPQCARCHAHIDPLGLALENFDAAGGWREREASGPKGRVERDDPRIDAAVVWPGPQGGAATRAEGVRFQGPDGLERELLRRSDQFRRALTAKLFAYALGRELAPAEEPLVVAGAAHLRQQGDTLPALIAFIVDSPAFLQP